eukprot:1831267-Rhodomonas_salina.1
MQLRDVRAHTLRAVRCSCWLQADPFSCKPSVGSQSVTCRTALPRSRGRKVSNAWCSASASHWT